MRITALALLVVALFVSTAWAKPPLDEVVVETNVRVPMRDGVSLATDMYLPPRGTTGQRAGPRS